MRQSPPVRPSSSLVLLALALVAAVFAVLPSAAAPAKKATTKKAAAPVDSLAILEAAVRRDSTNARAQYRLGLAYLDRDRPQEALRAFQVATRSKPDYLEAWVNLGASNDAIGHGTQARENYRQALLLAPDDEIALCRLASSFYAMNYKDSAMVVLRQTLEKHPRSHCSYFTLGVAFADGGMFREAIAAWDKVSEFAPGSPEAESAKESVRLLKEYLGKDSLRTASAGKPGVPPGSGGPGEALPGGGMMNSTKPAAAAPAGHSAGDGHGHDHDHANEKKKTGDK
jgi:protein O-mannosyl-transferase